MNEAEASHAGEPSRALTLITALASGVFLALAVHIGLSLAGAGLAKGLQGSFPGSLDQFKMALAWWAIGIAGCLGSLAAIFLLRKFSARPRLASLLRIILGVVFFCLLAAAGHEAASAAPGRLGMITIINLAAMALGAFMAFFAAHFAARR